MAVGAAFGVHEELVRVIGLMQESRMGIYVHQGTDGDAVVLRELVTDAVCRVIVPSGYRGSIGRVAKSRSRRPPTITIVRESPPTGAAARLGVILHG